MFTRETHAKDRVITYILIHFGSVCEFNVNEIKFEPRSNTLHQILRFFFSPTESHTISDSFGTQPTANSVQSDFDLQWRQEGAKAFLMP